MENVDNQVWCHGGNCPCPVWEYTKDQNGYFSSEQAADDLMLPLKRVAACLENLKDFNAVCYDKSSALWGLDYPYR